MHLFLIMFIEVDLNSQETVKKFERGGEVD